MLEFELQFPFESQISITVNDVNRIGIATEIGTTEIDLEARLFAKCYATCGLPKSFDMTKNREWRDSMRPSEIFTHMCKKFKLKPSFKENSLHIKIPKLEQKNGMVQISFNDHQYDDKNIRNLYKVEQEKAFKKNSKFNQEFLETFLKERLSFEALSDWEKLTEVTE